MEVSTIRPEQPKDISLIYTLLTSCFPTDAEARLVDALRGSGNLKISLVYLTPDNILVGYVAFSPVSIDGESQLGISLAPVAVHENYRKKGIAFQLIDEGLRLCEDMSYKWSCVLGDPKYYGRFGYERASKHGLGDEYEGGEAFQVMKIGENGAVPKTKGIVKYVKEFQIFNA
ncbi:hypothetical protein FGO68_gene14817 [Halteria grandinella]|uniref:N-acetyltransferase domain-containing protein n=1 Tax=Halteria grandinella TaxID=5974 RepID=A0A8J8SYT2_HALGN|nr:hypothetical protein FGO68_gene14817 [Halteria grandinella]